MGRRHAFVRGAARTLDMGGSGRAARSAKTGRYVKRTDAAAMAQDWKAVGDDLRGAMRSVSRSALSR
jgi:hypothetical protein